MGNRSPPEGVHGDAPRDGNCEEILPKCVLLIPTQTHSLLLLYIWLTSGGDTGYMLAFNVTSWQSLASSLADQ